eukprot:CAMPEP_0201717846 /NCGR_PEP_ID=MMETSP0593-20130828/3525_1 /ASSEMBLY_ACC=CAM_ASM_000672 /TAXON_ID=267983 /ORGANISM="Skeletonema japonicum, Strain CCMP2506" /LENGTH=663 /DNA_ID=CAMNT_0048208019 /DNA_START=209 /DNA_END=2200 /DNA_ORIENTATION=+
MILKKAKGSGSSTRRSSTNRLDVNQQSEKSSSDRAKKPSRSRAILQSAADITGRLSQRSTRKKLGRSGKGGGIAKGQKAFYRSSKGICKVTVVGVHHDAKLEPYYTIRLRDGKEKQVGGKHLTPVQDVDKSIKKDSKQGEKSDRIKKGSSHGESVAAESKKGSAGTEQTFDSTSDEGSAAGSSDDNISSDLDEQFATGQSAYYCSSDGHVSKVKVIKVYPSSSSSKHKYSVHLPDGNSKDIDADQLKALMDLTTEELAVLMKEKNEKPSSNKEMPALASTEDVDPGYEAEKSESSQGTAEQKSSENNQEPLALPCSFEMVEAKTEEGGTKMVPRYAARTKLYYKNADGIQMATILESHLDDLFDPYYTIRLEDGREKQTDNAHLLMTLPEGEGVEVKKEEQLEEMKQKTDVDMEESEESKERESPTSETVVEKNSLDTPAKQETVAQQSLAPVKERNKIETPVNSGTSDVGQEATPTTKGQRKADPAASALTLVHNFSLHEAVLYSSSQGEHYRATVVKLLKDKKHRPYYVVRLPDGKEKQVYDHRLSPLRVGRTDSSVEETKRSGRSRSATRRRSISETPLSKKTLSRADSIESQATSNTQNRRATTSDDKRKSFSRSQSLSRRSVTRTPRSQSRATSRSRGQAANEDARLSMRSLRKSIVK